MACGVSGMGYTERLVNAAQGYFLRSSSGRERLSQLLPVIKTCKPKDLFKEIGGLTTRGGQVLFEVCMYMPLAGPPGPNYGSRPGQPTPACPSPAPGQAVVGQQQFFIYS